MKKRLMAMVVSTILTASLLTGCGSGNTNENSQNTEQRTEKTEEQTKTNDTNGQQESAESTSSEEEVTLTVWCWDPA